MTVLPFDINTTYWDLFRSYCIKTRGAASIHIIETEMAKWGGVINWKSSWTVTFNDDSDATYFKLRWS